MCWNRDELAIYDPMLSLPTQDNESTGTIVQVENYLYDAWIWSVNIIFNEQWNKQFEHVYHEAVLEISDL